MDFLPIISALRRHRTAALLIILEIAFTCAIVCNAVFLIRERMSRMDRQSGVAESELVRLKLTGIGQAADPEVITRQDLQALREIPGVKYASLTNMVPFGGSSWNSGVSTIPDDSNSPINAATYFGSEDLAKTLGVRFIAGREFNAAEFISIKAAGSTAHLPSAIVSKDIADKLYPDTSAVGKPLYVWGKESSMIVGVIENVARPNDFQGNVGMGYSIFLPVIATFEDTGNYVMRVDPARKTEVLAAAEVALKKVAPNRLILDRQTFSDIRRDYFKQDRAMAWLLFGVSAALLIITALGVIGLASFWVQQRTRQIGVRRALGATRGDILRYFQTENFILATIGIILGMALAYGINMWLMDKYQIPRLPAEFLPIGAGLLWALGQIAVLGPALRAAAIPPALATRSV
jgi:putative ABC transport system permease protein